MKILFSKAGRVAYLADKEKMIFCIDDAYYDKNGNEVPLKKRFIDDCDDEYEYEKDAWAEDWILEEGLEEPLIAVSTTDIEWEVDDGFGNFGFKNKSGEFVIEPQFAYAHQFTNGLASVNLNRTWYKTQEGKRYYENHCGYIDKNGKAIIGFKYDEAYPFNKFGVAVVSTADLCYMLIDKQGNEFFKVEAGHISHYYDYNDRYLEFSYDDDDLVGIYDTKEKRILVEPSLHSSIEWGEECISVCDSNRHRMGPFPRYLINSKGKILYPWLYENEFDILGRADINKVVAVSKCDSSVLDDKYGLYSSKNDFILPMEYDKIDNLGDNVWACLKDEVVYILETDEND